MNSRILGMVETRRYPGLDADLETILGFSNGNLHYTEFIIGDWQSYVLWNTSGSDDDGLVADTDAAARPTPRGLLLPAINQLLQDTFVLEHLKLARLHSFGEGLFIPHRDFLELRNERGQWIRVQIPLLTNATSLHSEGDTVFHMRTGEIWFLDAANTHSACNLSTLRRLNLCLDFSIGNRPIQSIFRNPECTQNLPAPQLIAREPLDPEFTSGLYALAKILDDHNYRDVVGLLSKIHFYRDVGIDTFYDWLHDISVRSNKQPLLEKSAAFIKFLKAERQLHQRFAL